MFHRKDFDGVARIMESDAVVADTEPELRRIDILKPIDIAFAGGQQAGPGREGYAG